LLDLGQTCPRIASAQPIKSWKPGAKVRPADEFLTFDSDTPSMKDHLIQGFLSGIGFILAGFVVAHLPGLLHFAGIIVLGSILSAWVYRRWQKHKLAMKPAPKEINPS
jgi:hypothetical protein